MVLQAGAWPLNATPAQPKQEASPDSDQTSSKAMDTDEAGFSPPASLMTAIQHFEDFYSLQHSGRRLSWLHANSSADIKLNYLDKAYVVSMGVYQVSKTEI